MPCAICGQWIDRPQWQHEHVIDVHAFASGIPAVRGVRYAVCAPCSVQHRIHLITHYAGIASHGDLENLTERLADVLAWIVQHTTARR